MTSETKGTERDQERANAQAITEEDFLAYEDVRASGVTNMFDVKTVMNSPDCHVNR